MLTNKQAYLIPLFRLLGRLRPEVPASHAPLRLPDALPALISEGPAAEPGPGQPQPGVGLPLGDPRRASAVGSMYTEGEPEMERTQGTGDRVVDQEQHCVASIDGKGGWMLNFFKNFILYKCKSRFKA